MHYFVVIKNGKMMKALKLPTINWWLTYPANFLLTRQINLSAPILSHIIWALAFSKCSLLQTCTQTRSSVFLFKKKWDEANLLRITTWPSMSSTGNIEIFSSILPCPWKGLENFSFFPKKCLKTSQVSLCLLSPKNLSPRCTSKELVDIISWYTMLQ